MINWTEPTEGKEGASHYDHVMTDTPLGRIMIEWKSWKESPDYGIGLDNEWIGSSHDLEEAKAIAEGYLRKKSEELIEYLK